MSWTTPPPRATMRPLRARPCFRHSSISGPTAWNSLASSVASMKMIGRPSPSNWSRKKESARISDPSQAATASRTEASMIRTGCRPLDDWISNKSRILEPKVDGDKLPGNAGVGGRAQESDQRRDICKRRKTIKLGHPREPADLLDRQVLPRHRRLEGSGKHRIHEDAPIGKVDGSRLHETLQCRLRHHVGQLVRPRAILPDRPDHAQPPALGQPI